MEKRNFSFALALLLLAAGMFAVSARGESYEKVDLALVLAVDISSSIDEDERALQRSGYVKAFRSAEVINAIVSGRRGAITVTYFEWSGRNTQTMVVPWFRIDGASRSLEFAGMLGEIGARRHDTTSISGAMKLAADLLEDFRHTASRRVVDISGDGPNNQGDAIAAIRDALVEDDIVINGLPLLMKPHEYSGYGSKFLDRYYRECVIGGPGSFIIPVKSWTEFSLAIRQKLLREIAGISPAIHPPITTPVAMRAGDEVDAGRVKNASTHQDCDHH